MTKKIDEFGPAHLNWEYEDLFTIKDGEGKPHKKVTSPKEWALKRNQIKDALLSVFGSFPSERCPLNPAVIDEKQIGDMIFRTLEYNVEKDDRIRSYLAFPVGLKQNEKLPIVLALHPSGGGGASCFNYHDQPEMSYGQALVSKGFAVLAPDGICFGDHIYPGESRTDFTDSVPFYKRHPEWSTMGKLVYDAMRSLDYIETLEFVDKDRIGALGHSLGGYWTMFTAAFDERIFASVSSCGFVPFRTDTGWGTSAANPWPWNVPCRWARNEPYFSHMPRLGRCWQKNIQPPFDFHDVMAAIAPRPFLNSSGWQDTCWQDASGIPEVCKLVEDVYRFHGVPDRFKNHMFDGGHEHFASEQIYSWMEFWLKKTEQK